MKTQIIENLVSRVKEIILLERKSDELSYFLSRMVIDNFKEGKDFDLEGLYFERGDDYASFDFKCSFIEDIEMDDNFSIHAEADMQELEIQITFNPNYFPRSLNDLVAEVRETIEHELEHIEQQNFEDMEVQDDDDIKEKDENFVYLTSNIEVPAYVRGLIKRSKVKKITLSQAMEEWFSENFKKFSDPENEWPIVKKIWMDYAKKMRSLEKIKKFK